MKESNVLIVLVASLILIFLGVLFLPMFMIYGGFGLLHPFAVKERYTLEYYIHLESYEPFENVTVLVPTAKLGSMELIPTRLGFTPTNFETVKIGNRTYIKLTRDKPFSEKHRLWGENKTITMYTMDFTVRFPKIRIENLSEYRINDGDVRILLNYTNASYVRLQTMLYYLELDYVNVFGKKIYTNFGHYNYLWCETIPINVTKEKRSKWIKAPVSCCVHKMS